MLKKLICIECPKSCTLSVEIEGNKIINIEGHQCPKGEKYAVSEIKHPVRMLTSTVLTRGLPLKMISVRTDNPIPKARMLEAMTEIKKVRITKRLKVGDVVIKNFLGLKVNLIATRSLDV